MAKEGKMKMMTKEVIEKLPGLRAMENKEAKDVKVIVKFFDPTGSWTWYATEGSKTGEVIGEGAFRGEENYEFFGYVKGLEGELGYFTLAELSVAKQGCRGLQSLPIERDRHYGFEHTLEEVMKE